MLEERKTYELNKLYLWNKNLPKGNIDGKEIIGLKPIDKKSYWQYDFNNSLDFLDVFDVNKSELYESEFENYKIEYLYRGHENYKWALIPSHFRKISQNLMTSYAYANGVQQGEFKNFIRFIKGMDELGLYTNENSFNLTKLLNQSDEALGLNDTSQAIYFPKEKNLYELALAQHYGVPTRLLDFTKNPLVSIFFATEKLYPFSKYEEDKRIGVWVIPKLLIEVAKHERYIKFIDVKKHQNKYIAAQKGIFLNYIPPCVEQKENGTPFTTKKSQTCLKSLDQILTEKFETSIINQIIEEQIGRPMLFTLPHKELHQVSMRLEQLNINWTTMMPSLDGVKKEVERYSKKPYSNI